MYTSKLLRIKITDKYTEELYFLWKKKAQCLHEDTHIVLMTYFKISHSLRLNFQFSVQVKLSNVNEYNHFSTQLLFTLN